ncbi:hypothetical protein HYPSUDRAFT_38782 [Hypholoma sublateritium FD-334 SS-4]|uniref:Uncharacterized protein n=1 Tax=Hypholoma sublateritium (strain FD-334 SS-4) TaxID=945553 RepID=A0A0D2LAT5_HYPSF|nr:hypothetical protein HYPSUDRAFT_38782 [Hypholoma sublateritium FD-334 SS-4]
MPRKLVRDKAPFQRLGFCVGALLQQELGLAGSQGSGLKASDSDSEISKVTRSGSSRDKRGRQLVAKWRDGYVTAAR